MKSSKLSLKRLKGLEENEEGLTTVEYAIVLMVATLAAVLAMYKLGQPLMAYYVWARTILLLPI